MMNFFSTRDHDRIVTASQAIAQGLSDEGGLFVPERFPQVDVRALCQLDYPALAAAVVSEYLTDYSKDFLAEAARTTYGEAFGGKAGYLAPVEGDTYALELWHGPTCAFKDYALQLMPKLLVEAKKNLSRTEKTLILVATSGDTGKAALDGYHDIPGVEIAVFYPTGGTSEIQRLQMATQEGANVAVYAVRGNFDDAQTGVKRVFGDKAIAAKLAERNIRLSRCVIRPQDDRPHSWGRRLRLYLRRGRVLRRSKPVLRDLLQAEIVGRPLRGPRRPVKKVLLRLEGRPGGVVLRPLGQTALRAKHLDTEFPQLPQNRALPGQGLPKGGKGGPEVGVRRQNGLEPLLELGHPAGGRRAPAHENHQEQSQTDPQLDQAHPLPGARRGSPPPLRRSARTRSSSSADPLCGLVVHPDPSLIRSLLDSSRYS